MSCKEIIVVVIVVGVMILGLLFLFGVVIGVYSFYMGVFLFLVGLGIVVGIYVGMM